jgi:hypothetical protein
MMFWPLAALGVSGGVLLRRRSIRLLPLIAPLGITIIAAAFYGLLRFRARQVSLVVLGGIGAGALVAGAGSVVPMQPTRRSGRPSLIPKSDRQIWPIPVILAGFGRD